MPDVRAGPIVVPLLVAVKTPVSAFTLVNPFTTEPNLYDLEADNVPYVDDGIDVVLDQLLNTNVVLPPDISGVADVAPAPIVG